MNTHRTSFSCSRIFIIKVIVKHTCVKLDGCTFHSGKYDGAVSKAKFERLLAEWLSNGKKVPGPKRLKSEQKERDLACCPEILSVNELCVR